MSIDNNNMNNKLQTLEKLLQDHDWFYQYSDDFRVYERGTYGLKDARFVIFVFNEGTQQKIGKIYKNIDEITKMGKEPIIAVIERRGEIIYYKVNKMIFLENKPELQMKDFDFN